jgi:hypothetical protein
VIDVQRLLEVLADSGTEFVVIGGVAMVLRGSGRVTVDIDVCYARDDGNLARLARALAPYQPRLRGAPQDLPFPWDDRTLRSGLNFTLTTDLGDLDLLGEVPGLGSFEAVARGATRLEIGRVHARVLDLDALERSKRAAGRAKDLLDLAEIAEIRRRAKP